MLLMLYLVAITAEAMTGGSAGRRGMDWFGVILIACVTALGGGSVRDVLLGNYPLTWVKHPEYLILTSVAALVTIFIAPLMRHLRSLFLVLDAAGAGGVHPDRLHDRAGNGQRHAGGVGVWGDHGCVRRDSAGYLL